MLKLFSLFFLMILPLLAEEIPSEEKFEPETIKSEQETPVATYQIDDYSVSPEKEYTLKPFFATRKSSLSLKSSNNSTTFATKPLSTAGANLYFGNFGAGIGVAIDNGLYSDKKYGKTESSDFQLGYFAPQIIAVIYFTSYKGFYETDSQNPLGQKKSLASRPKMESYELGISGTYFFNTNFSYSAAFNQHRIQKKSAFSLVLEGNLYQNKISDMSDSDAASFINLAVLGGGAAIYVQNSFFASAMFVLGPAIQYQKFDKYENEEDKMRPSFKGKVKFSTGYNSERFFGGIGGDTAHSISFLSDSKLIYADYLCEFFLGLRF